MTDRQREIIQQALQDALYACKMLQDAFDKNDVDEALACLDALSSDVATHLNSLVDTLQE